MLFKLTTANDGYYQFSSIEHIDKLKSLGFEFKDGRWYPLEITNEVDIEINSLDDLMKLVEMFEDVIVSKDEIKIYDGRIE